MARRNDKTTALTLKTYIEKKVLGYLGLVESQISPQSVEHSFLINDFEKLQRTKLREYNVWYSGDSDNLLDFYTRQNMIEYNYEPYFDRNKRNYFWAISSTEDNYKRTHSGQPRNIVDTLVNIIGMPKLAVTTEEASSVLSRILTRNKFKKLLLQTARPLTLVEGWGCYKINWDKSISDLPIILYYRAENVDFVVKSQTIVAVIFKDYYYDDKGKKYLLIETRSKGTEELLDEKTQSKQPYPCLIITKELFRIGDGDGIIPVDFSEVPQLRDTKAIIKVSNYSGLFAAPNIYYEDVEMSNPGRSIFTGKIDLFDDLDLCLSQSSNTVRKSTPHEYFNTNFLERDKDTGMPIMPTAFDRTYTMVTGPKDANGVAQGAMPVTVTQPNLDTSQYDNKAINILIQIVNGVMSPATLGIDIAKKDNAEAQREKEKITIFTRNTIIAEETDTLAELCRELLCAEQFMREGTCTFEDYKVQVHYDEYADSSFENRSNSLLTIYNAGVMSPGLFVDLMWGDTISKQQKKEQLDFIESERERMMMGQMPPEMLAMYGVMGADGGGYNQLKANPGPESGVNIEIEGEKR